MADFAPRLIVSVVVTRDGGRLADGATITHTVMPEGMTLGEVQAFADRYVDAIREEVASLG